MRRVLALMGIAALAGAVPAAGLALPGPNEPLPLEEAIRIALEQNPDIKVQAYNPQIARANVLTAYGQFDPALVFKRSYSRSYGYPSVPEPLPSELSLVDDYSLALQGALPLGTIYSIGGSAENARGPYNNYQHDFESFGGINVTQPLLRGFGFGANLVGLRVAKANRGISDWQYRQTLINTVTNVIDTYSSLILAQNNLQIAKGSIDLAATLVKQNEQKLTAGNASQSDVTEAQAQLAARQESLIEAQYNLRTEDNELRQLLGQKTFPPDEPLLRVTEPEPPPLVVHPAADYQYALANRPDYQAARLGIAIDKADASAARNGLLPQVNLVASYGYNGLSPTFAAARRMVATEDFPSSSIGLNFSVPIFNAQGRGQARAARLTLEQAQENLRSMEADIALAVANAGNLIATNRDRVVADAKAVSIAQDALSDEEKKVAQGSQGASTSTIIQYQTYLIDAQSSLASAKTSERTAVASYDQTLGSTLVRYHIDLADNPGH